MLGHDDDSRSRGQDRMAWLGDRQRNQTRRFDTRFAQIYDEHWGRIHPSHARMLGRFLDRCRSGGDILDAACGTGKYWQIVLASGRRLHGIDQSAEMLHQARSKYPDVSCEVRALADLDEIAAYDGIMCVDAMEYVPPEEWPSVLGNFHRALRRNGMLYFTVEQIDPFQLEAETARSRAAGHPVVEGESVIGSEPEEDDGYHYFPTRGQVAQWLRGAELVLVEEMLGDDYLHLIARR